MNSAASTSNAEGQPAWANHTVFRSSRFRGHARAIRVNPTENFKKPQRLHGRILPDPSLHSRSSVQIPRSPVSRQFTGFHGESDRVRPNFSKLFANPVSPVAEFLTDLFVPFAIFCRVVSVSHARTRNPTLSDRNFKKIGIFFSPDPLHLLRFLGFLLLNPKS
jgi:hypothetical protein